MKKYILLTPFLLAFSLSGDAKIPLNIHDTRRMIKIHISILENDIVHNRTYGFRALKEFLIEKNNNMLLLLDPLQGSLEKTENSLDIAIVGPCFIKLGSENENHLVTRNGQFRINAKRKLYHLMNPAITLKAEFPTACLFSSAEIDSAGKILCTDSLGKKLSLGQLNMIEPLDQRFLKRLNPTLYEYPAEKLESNSMPADCTINPGFLENSNTNIQRNMKRINELKNDLKLLGP